MNYFSFLFSPAAQALGHTLLYSLWQAFIVFICLRLILKCMPKASSRFKYLISYIAHVGIATWFVITLLQQLLLQKSEFISQEIMQHPAFQQSIFDQHLTTTSGSLSFSFLTIYFPWIVAFYLLGIVWFGLRLMLNYSQTIRLKTNGLNELESVWKDHVRNLAHKMGILKNVHIYISHYIGTPVMVGFFKPFILLPLAAINNLSSQQIEAILLHELAHIRRNDYLFNLVQSVIDIVLFFNPFAWWISKNIRKEREKSCDEIVLQLTDPFHYAKALLALEEFGHNKYGLVMAAVSKRSQLLHRIKNIMEMQNNRINLRQKLIAVAIMITGTITIACLTPQENKAAHSGKEVVASKKSLSIPVINQVQTVFLKGDDFTFKASADTLPEIVPPLPPNPMVPSAPPEPAVPPVPPVPPVPAVPPMPPFPHLPPDSSAMSSLNATLKSLNSMMDTFPALKNNFNSAEWKKMQKAISKNAASMQKYFKSKAWKKQQEMITQSTADITKYFSSPEWKQQQEEIQKSADKTQQYFNSPEWKKQQEEIQKNTEKMRQYFKSDDWKKQQEEIKKNAEKMKQYFNSDKWKKQQEEIKHSTDSLKTYFNSDSWKKQQENIQKAVAQSSQEIKKIIEESMQMMKNSGAKRE